MTSAPREQRDNVRDPLSSGEVRIAALAAALRAVKPQDEPEGREGDDAGTVRRAA